MSTILTQYKGRTVTKEELDRLMPPKANWLEAPPMAANTYSEHDPLISEGLGCMKHQVKDMRKMIESEGIQGINVLDSGQVRITSRRGRNQLIRTLSEIRGVNMHDADGGYGDA